MEFKFESERFKIQVRVDADMLIAMAQIVIWLGGM